MTQNNARAPEDNYKAARYLEWLEFRPNGLAPKQKTEESFLGLGAPGGDGALWSNKFRGNNG
ncbi:MAG: hypothetical protein JWM04_847 [Verrucomicrobiales bacterium]|nr:hypothetical protein [Verrucomicrobiales bacterium]